MQQRFGMLLLLVCAAVRSGPAFAQVGGTLEGVVTDSSRAVVPGVTVIVTNSETGISRETTTDSQGRYIFNSLPPARYDLTASLAGFKTTRREGVTLTVGAELVVDLTLELGAVAEQVTVTGEAPLVETRSGSVSGVIEEKVIREIPLNGRSFANLMELQPGVIVTRAAGRSTTAGTGDKMALGGARPNQMSFLLDGADMMGKDNTNPAGASGVLLGVDTVQEFRVSTSGFSAEYGRNSGGVVSAVTKSGTNNFHGTLFHFLRNDNLDAPNYFDGDEQPEFKRNQFGGTLGGPILQNRTFFFGSYEGLRERLGVTNSDLVPTAEARTGIIRNYQTGAVAQQVTVANSIKPYLDLYPLPNGANEGLGTGRYFWAGSENTDQNDFLIRIDHQLSSHDSLMGRVFFDDGESRDPGSLGLISSVADSRIQSYVADHKRIFGSSLVNDFRVVFTRSRLTADNHIPDRLNALEFIPGRGYGILAPGGIAGISSGGTEPRFWTQNLFEYIDDAVLSRGAHTYKLGGIAKRIRYNGFSAARFRGEYQFSNLANFLTAVPSRYEAAYVFAGTRGLRQWLFGLYFQDDWRMNSRLTLNLGVRYEVTTVPTEVNGNLANLRNQLDPQVTVGDPLWINPSLKNFSPRIGFAYDPWGDGKTSVRGGYGIYFDQLLPIYYRDSPFRILPYQQRFFITPTDAIVPGGVIPFPNAINLFVPQARLSDPNVQVDLSNYRPHQPYTMQYNLTIQRELFQDFSLMIGYLGSQSRNNSRNVNWNSSLPTSIVNGQKFWAAGSPRRNPNFAAVLQREFDSNANYNSLQLQAKKRFSKGYDLNLVYQWSRTMDMMSGIGGSTDFGNITSFSMDPEDRGRDYGRAAFDIRHYLTINGTVEISGGDFSGAARQMLSGWRLSSLFTYSSGEPFSVTNRFDRAPNNVRIFGFQERPNVAPGASNNPTEGTSAGCSYGGASVAAGTKLGTPNLWFDPCAIQLQPAGFLGNLGRNTLQGPDVLKLDLAVLKDFRFSENHRLEFRWEIFNLFDRANFDVPNFNVFLSGSPTAGGNGSAGKITSTRTSARQMQLALKYIF
ncbi:MAG TPA: TonB-dependent receptor [Terriglobia bacterium]|nr:TonB-dependent receptor [Terriglobia bacterium]